MALQNLRDKLLKAGLVDKKQKQQVDTQDRKDKRQKGIDKQAEEEAERQRLFAERQAAEAEAQRQQEAERARERAEHDLHNRVRNICDRWAVRSHRPGVHRFYFVQRNARIGHLMVSDAFYDQLLTGALAVVERLSPEEVAPALGEIATGRKRKRSLLEEMKKDRRGARSSQGPKALSGPETHVLLPPEAAERILELDAGAVCFWARGGRPLGYIAEPAT